MLESKSVFPLFFVVWAVLAACGVFFFTTDKDVARKRRYFPRYTIGTGVMFGLAVALLVPWPALLLFAPFIALITWLNLRMTRFCDCGRLLINHAWWTKMSYCPYCGKKLAE